jgi:signal transduction histidine kinase
VNPAVPPTQQARADALRLHGFTESGSEGALRDLLRLARTFCGAPAVLGLRDEGGLWFLEGSGLAAVHQEALDRHFAKAPEVRTLPVKLPGLPAQEKVPVEDTLGRRLGMLSLHGSGPLGLGEAQKAGLAALARQIGSLVSARGDMAERRSVSRGPAGASFVPGLVHELRNFIFGISASLDAFQARFAGQEDLLRYGNVMRASLDRLNAFLEELKEYGDPHMRPFAQLPLESLLREAIEVNRPLALRNEVDIQLQVAGPLPPVMADDQSLRAAFVRLLDLALQQESPGGCVVVRVGKRAQGNRDVIFGYLDGSGLKLQNMDLTRLFEPFYYRASGLGRLVLPVARRIIEAHGGNLSAAPGPEGGMRVGFMLPTV